MNTTRRTRVQRILTRTAGTLCLFGAIACILLVAIGGAYPSEKHGVRVVVPRTGDVWQVGELHTVQWTLNGMPTTNSSGDPLMAIFILSYTSGAPDSHVLLGHLTDWFPITDRLANIMVPSVPTREDYSLYMFSHDNRDVSNWSGALTIFNPEDVEGIEQPENTFVVTTAPPVSVTISLTSTFSDSELSSSLLSSNLTDASTTAGAANTSTSSGFASGNVSLTRSAPSASGTPVSTPTTVGPESSIAPSIVTEHPVARQLPISSSPLRMRRAQTRRIRGHSEMRSH